LPARSAYLEGRLAVKSNKATTDERLRRLIGLAESGNLDAGGRLLRIASEGLDRDWALPAALAEWLASRLDDARQHPRQAGQKLRIAQRKGNSSVASRLPVDDAEWHLSGRKAYAARRVLQEYRAGAPLTPPDAQHAAPKIVADELNDKPGPGNLQYTEYAVRPRTVLNWFYERKWTVVDVLAAGLDSQSTPAGALTVEHRLVGGIVGSGGPGASRLSQSGHGS